MSETADILRKAARDELIAAQSVKRCRICQRIERYCQTDGQGRGAHEFTPILTCESCKHMGGKYRGDADMPIHHCLKSKERRAANFNQSGDPSQDFLDEFRKFYDASPQYGAEKCKFFEPRAIALAEKGVER